jgi:Ran GTPase-activating protein (RanGAP) involved in mRNA processing and transport
VSAVVGGPRLSLNDERSSLRELHIADNKIAASGIAQIFDAIAAANHTLQFLDVSSNMIDIGLLRSLRKLVERSASLHYLTINNLHKFNARAIDSLTESLAASPGIKLVNLKKTTRAFFFKLEAGVNNIRE